VKSALILHLPHSSVAIPPDVRSEILLDDQELSREILLITDRYTDELFVLEGAVRVVNPWSRLVFDPERFRDDNDEPMALHGMGAIYVKTSHGKPMRGLSAGRREEMMGRFYDPHHARLTEETARALDTRGGCLIVDCHSFPSVALPFEADRVSQRPDICIGTSSFHTPAALTTLVERYVARHGLSTRRDFPFAGTITPIRYYGREARVRSIMIEVNRRLYMDESTGKKTEGFPRARDMIHGLLRELEEASP
jgi:N-formylglutamate amidohydrolase